MLRYPRGAGEGVPLPERLEPLTGPWVEVLREGDDVLLLGTGTGVRVSLAAAEVLADAGVTATVANVRRVRPLDVDALLGLLCTHPAAVTVEENALAGGLRVEPSSRC